MRDFVNAFNEIVSSYAATALWSSVWYDNEEDFTNGVNEFNLDDRYDVTDISDETMNSFRKDIADFIELLEDVEFNGSLITINDISSHMTWGQFGHDFWLTRNGHGAGFWDRGYGDFGDVLTKWAKTFGEVDLFVNADNEIESN